jgi:hypothetical protein
MPLQPLHNKPLGKGNHHFTTELHFSSLPAALYGFDGARQNARNPAAAALRGNNHP